MTDVKIRFEREKETKNTVRFSEAAADGDPLVVGTLYVQKFALKELGQPEAVEIIIRPASSAS